MKRAALAALLLLLDAGGAAADQATAKQLAAKTLTDDWSYRFLEDLTTEVGQRLAGTEAQVRAARWAEARLKAAGFANVHQETFPMTGWERGVETARVVAPVPQNLAVTALGDSVATPDTGIEAEIALFRTYAALLAAAPGSLAGKIAVVTQHMPRTEDGSGYGASFVIRGSGPSEAAKRGAVAYLLRSLGTDSARRPHTGQLDYAEDAPKIPAAALSNPDADLLERLAAHGPVRVHLVLTPMSSPTAQSSNVVGEITGSSKPGEIVLIGGHLDSWDLGTGAIDDGAGMAITAGAARLIGTLPRHPARTIRVVLFGAEERSYSGKAYAAAHQTDAGAIVLAAEADFGARRAYAIQLPPGIAKTGLGNDIGAAEATLGVFVDRAAAERSGSDVEDLHKLGVPVLSVRQDGSDYFDFHHTADDTFDKVDRNELAQATAAWAAWVYLVADSDVDFRAATAKPAP
ncbi:MAG TPA: M28 family peptidase [Stellaceae bacterium]|nr:M28 family peptidase [Stellaceae bacterium]